MKSPFDRTRFEKCLALAERGATSGERAAGRAAAERVASGAGLAFDQAVAILRRQPPAQPYISPQRQHRPSYRPPPPPPKPKPVTIEELLQQKAAHAEELKRKANRAEKNMEEFFREQEAHQEAARAEQARRDREWAEQRLQARESAAAATEASR